MRRFQLLGVGPVAQCSVGRDANGDGRAAGGKGSGGREPTGVTDAAGKFELATLDAPSPEGAAVLANGAEEALPCTDVATGLPAALPLLACDGSAVVSPLTSLAAAVMRASGRRDSAQALDMTSIHTRLIHLCPCFVDKTRVGIFFNCKVRYPPRVNNVI